jgi:D-amino-acid dehydrogenase
LPELAGWGVEFLRNSRRELYERSTISNLRLALHSMQVMEALRLETGIGYLRGAGGSLKIFRTRVDLDRAARAAERLTSGLRFRLLSAEQAVALEPALAPIAGELGGAVHFADDETGDAYTFCRNLAEAARKLGVEFHFRTRVTSFESRSGRVTATLSGARRFVADRYVVAAGSYSTPLLSLDSALCQRRACDRWRPEGLAGSSRAPVKFRYATG